MIQHMRVGMPIISRNIWREGFEYLKSLVKGVSFLPLTKRPRLFLIVTEANMDETDDWLTLLEFFDGVMLIGERFEKITTMTTIQVTHCHSYHEALNKIDFYFPVIADFWQGKCAAAWIPEINHRVQSDFFLHQDIVYRNEKLAQIAEQARIIVFNSVSVAKTFFELYPSCKALSAYLPFRIYPDEHCYTDNPQEVQLKHGLPEQFVVCCNNFKWHKNYPTLFKAIAVLRQGGNTVHVVCAIQEKVIQHDMYFKALKQYIQELGIADLVHIVSGISYQEEIQLIRCSLLVIQPSLMEEVGSIIDLCQAMAKPIISSDIDMHQEKEYGIYFNGTDAYQLAERLVDLLSSSKAEPDLSRANEAKLQACAMNRKMAEDFCHLVDQSQFIVNRESYEARKIHNSDDQTILLATSLAASKDLNNQRAAVNSWQRYGFKVVSINSPEEIALLQPHFTDIGFVQAHRDTRADFGKAYIYFDDFLSYFAKYGTKICGIINSDIHLLDDKMYSFVEREAINSLVYGSRIDVNSLDKLQGKEYFWGFDYFFFDWNLIPYYPNSQFCIGMPVWDYWAVLVPLFYRIPAKRVVNAGFYHIKHQESWRQWLNLFETKLSKYITRITDEAWSMHFRDFICQLSREVLLDTQDVTLAAGGDQDINRIIGDEVDLRMMNGVRFMIKKN